LYWTQPSVLNEQQKEKVELIEQEEFVVIED
jgi:hypothetical protein